jgi:hypothetical protein
MQTYTYGCDSTTAVRRVSRTFTVFFIPCRVQKLLTECAENHVGTLWQKEHLTIHIHAPDLNHGCTILMLLMCTYLVWSERLIMQTAWPDSKVGPKRSSIAWIDCLNMEFGSIVCQGGTFDNRRSKQGP